MYDRRSIKLAQDSWMLAWEASAVVWLRLSRMALMDAEAMAEARLMVDEKVDAALELQRRVLTGQLGTSHLSVAQGSVSHVRKTVAANRRRLSGAKPRKRTGGTGR